MIRLTSLAACTFAALVTLSGCGGGGDDAATPAPPTAPAGPTVLKTTDTVVGTGVVAAAGDRVQVNYAGYLYDPAAANNKGKNFETSPAGKPFTFVIGASNSEAAITGFSQGVQGMKVGGKRTIVIPAALAYGSKAVTNSSNVVVIPANSALVYDVELVKDCGTKTC